MNSALRFHRPSSALRTAARAPRDGEPARADARSSCAQHPAARVVDVVVKLAISAVLSVAVRRLVEAGRARAGAGRARAATGRARAGAPARGRGASSARSAAPCALTLIRAALAR